MASRKGTVPSGIVVNTSVLGTVQEGKCYKLTDGRVAKVEKVHSPLPIQIEALGRKEFEILFGGSKGGSKASPLDSRVLTPFGWKKMGDIRVGDVVSNPTTGGTSKVLAIFPQGVKPVYRVSFDDDTSLEVTEDHLWAFRTVRHIRPGTKKSIQRSDSRELLGTIPLKDRWSFLKVNTTSSMKKYLDEGFNPRIPLSDPVLFTRNGRSGTGWMPPYLMGLFLGDGCNQSLSISSCDDEIRDYLIDKGFRPGNGLHTDGKPLAWFASGTNRKKVDMWLRNNNLRQSHSWEKFIPDYIFTSSLEFRLEVLRGLMDTDGSVDERGRCYFLSTSERLTQGVRELVWSLGGKASLKLEYPTFTYLGEKKEGRKAYRTRLWLPKTSAMFKLSRKRERCTDSWNGGYELSREVVKIEPVGEKECQCISVDNPYGLYIADDYIVTHNSHCGMLWLLGIGDDPSKELYIHHPKYRALVLRRNQIDLAEWVDRAASIYKELFGATYKDRPYPHYEFPSGAKICIGHLADEDAYEKWQGQEFQRMLIEELTQIPTYRLYALTIANCRSTIPELVPQVFLTTNPIGPGTGWVRDRFVEAKDEHGHIVPPKHPIIEKFVLPDGSTIQRSRVFIPARLTDNPYLMRDSGYMAQLMALPDNERRALLDGDWRALAGTMFTSFRPRGPLQGEPPEANHLIQANELILKPWWHRWMALDWGYREPTAVVWGCYEPGGHLYIYRELTRVETSPEEIGAEIARLSLMDLEGMDSRSMTLWFDPSAAGKRSEEKTVPEQLKQGMERVLGANSVFLAGADDLPNMSFLDRVDEQRKMTVVIRPAQNARISGWQLVNQMLRWWPVIKQDTVQFDRDYASQLIYSDKPDLYDKYIRAIRDAGKHGEVLPLIKFSSACPRTIHSLETLVHDSDKNPEDVLKCDTDHWADALRYLCVAFKNETNLEPFEAFRERRLKEIEGRRGAIYDPNARVWVARKIERDYADKNAGRPLVIHRAATARRAECR